MTHSEKRTIATEIATLAKDYSRDYGISFTNALHMAVKAFGANLEWDYDTRYEMFKAAQA